MVGRRRCPKCRSPELIAVKLGALEIDRCSTCRGLLLDHGEMRALLSQNLANQADSFNGAAMAEQMDTVEAHCFDCDADMNVVTTKTGVRADVCPVCKAVFLDEGELATLQLQGF